MYLLITKELSRTYTALTGRAGRAGPHDFTCNNNYTFYKFDMFYSVELLRQAINNDYKSPRSKGVTAEEPWNSGSDWPRFFFLNCFAFAPEIGVIRGVGYDFGHFTQMKFIIHRTVNYNLSGTELKNFEKIFTWEITKC